MTPSRFGRVSQGCYWNAGNGSPDAVCFSVDRPGVVIVGVGVYGGGAGSYECELELLDDVCNSLIIIGPNSIIITLGHLVFRLNLSFEL